MLICYALELTVLSQAIS